MRLSYNFEMEVEMDYSLLAAKFKAGGKIDFQIWVNKEKLK